MPHAQSPIPDPQSPIPNHPFRLISCIISCGVSEKCLGCWHWRCRRGLKVKQLTQDTQRDRN
ncbi:hypothetical protein BLD44_000030 [Mastigocladus laminosus UU774]|nr:hypothetical protein BLD44_000030 [Mastigocladus laminosus UU774]